MYRLIFLLCLSYITPSIVQSEQSKKPRPSQPENLIPLPEITELPPISEPPPLPEIDQDSELETQITIIKRGEDTIEEHRVNGELLMIKVIPRIGPPYYLKKNTIGNNPTHAGEPGIDVSPPMWQLLKF